MDIAGRSLRASRSRSRVEGAQIFGVTVFVRFKTVLAEKLSQAPVPINIRL